ncbi:glycosyltransferase family 4 protein [Cecembia lonarensis]|uniref:Glycosyltransferase, family n=1 Tax=Cecembia lonarensis (strain CCUG 58316 / KCTC 22772 / LW9) TaxID=1225176 RepID=K1LKE8_CECL9|nr:glycosyltransferase family 1 protein [Cecembia lonarensis]EKB50803.1 glycosyltransferase, family [Cecembia lonarensis LW9]
MKKKTVYVDLFYLNTALTGIKTYMSEFCEAVEENTSDEVSYIFSHNFRQQMASNFYRGNVAYWKKLFYHIYYFFWKQCLLPLKVKKSGADVLICFDFIAPAWPLKAKKLVVIHDAFFWQMPQNYNKFWRAYFIPMIHSGLRGKCTVVTTSFTAKKALEIYSGIHKNIEVIYQCPKLLPEHTQTEGNTLEKFGIQPKRYFLHVGSFDKRKMIQTLVDAFGVIEKKYPGKYSLVLVGERGLSLALDDYDNVVRKIKDENLTAQVKLTGFLPDITVKELYQNAFAYVFPSSNEGFGIPVIEAMNNHIPVIISNQDALMEIAAEAALIHEVGNAESLATMMERLIEDPTLIEELIEKGNRRCAHFNRSSFFNRFEKLIKQP